MMALGRSTFFIPRDFWGAFKDYDGSPIDVKEHQDAYEFFTRLQVRCNSLCCYVIRCLVRSLVLISTRTCRYFVRAWIWHKGAPHQLLHATLCITRYPLHPFDAFQHCHCYSSARRMVWTST